MEARPRCVLGTGAGHAASFYFHTDGINETQTHEPKAHKDLSYSHPNPESSMVAGGVCPKGIFAILSPLGPHGQDKLLPAGKGDTRLSWVDKARVPLAAQRQATKSLAHATPQKTITAVVDAHLW